MNRVFGLDILRALAIVFVLIAHSRFFLVAHTPAASFMKIFGFFGVEFFFVLSGFLIGGLVIKTLEEDPTPTGLITFWIRRWFRTLPNYFLFLTANCLFFYLVVKDSTFSWKYLLFLQNFAGEMPPFFPESWSLAVEEWFYLLLPLLGLAFTLATRRVRSGLLITILLVMAAATAFRVMHVGAHHPQWDEGVRKIVICRLDALMYGVFGAFCKRYHKFYWHQTRTKTFIVGLVAIAASTVCFYSLSLDRSFFNRTFLFSLTSFSVLCFLPVLDTWQMRSDALWCRLIENTSLYSYSLYLSNLLVYEALSRWAGSMIHDVTTGVAAVLVWLGLSFFISRTVYHYYEKPVMFLRDMVNLKRSETTVAG